MSGKETKKKIDLFQIDRPCAGKFDASQLGLQDVDRTTKHYSRKIIVFQDSDVKVTWSSEDVRKHFFEPYVTRDPISGSITAVKVPGKPARHLAPPADGSIRRTVPVNFLLPSKEVVYSLGLLYRYRMDWQPRGYGLGELLSSISLLPNEELTLEFKTWETDKRMETKDTTLTSKNTSDVKSTQSDVKEVLDDYQSKENFEFSAHAEAKWGWGSASADTKYSTEASEQHKTITKQSREGSQRASNALAQKRSVKVAVSRETGSEDKTTRKIKNINQCHTLNVNYYQLLKQYEVSMYLHEVEVILFGAQHATMGKAVTIGTIFPFMVPEPPTIPEVVESLLEYSLEIPPERFQKTILSHCTPRPDINDRDLKGKRRYAFEVNPGPFEDRDGDGAAEYPVGLGELLDYLYRLYTKKSPPPEMAKIPVVKEMLPVEEMEEEQTRIVVPRFHFLYGVEEAKFTKKVASIKKRILDEFVKVRKEITGQPIASWITSIPTYGVYAETMLGICSGCEDYFEVQRQFDLESKKLEVEKLKLEVEKLNILNQKSLEAPPGSNVIIKNPPDKSSIELSVDIKPTKEGTTVSFENEKS